MEKIPTAEEWLLNHKEMSKYDVAYCDEGGYLGVNEEALYKIMIEFAKLHVEAALKAASEKAITNVFPTDEEQWEHVPEIITSEDLEDNEGIYLEVDKNSILNSYPLENIK